MDGELLLRGVLEEPDEDAPRLVYADWLEEQGQDARAEFIRNDIALSEMIGPDHRQGLFANFSYNWPQAARELSIRQAQLFFSDGGAYPVHESQNIDWNAAWTKRHVQWDDWRRGFPAIWRPTIREFMKNAAIFFAEQPIKSVRLTDRVPFTDTFGEAAYATEPDGNRFDHSACCIPLLVARHLGVPAIGGGRWYSFGDRPTAEAALDRALVLTGRKMANLTVFDDPGVTIKSKE